MAGIEDMGKALKAAFSGLTGKADKPKDPGDPNKPKDKAQSDEQLFAELDEKFKQAERIQKDMERLWKENLAFLEGIQMMVSNQAIMVNIQGHTSHGRERMVDNRILDNARRLHARLDQP